ncbi:uncharacterized protein METZ01_LOCUS489972, partial [marine metagenome]
MSAKFIHPPSESLMLEDPAETKNPPQMRGLVLSICYQEVVPKVRV